MAHHYKCQYSKRAHNILALWWKLVWPQRCPEKVGGTLRFLQTTPWEPLLLLVLLMLAKSKLNSSLVVKLCGVTYTDFTIRLLRLFVQYAFQPAVQLPAPQTPSFPFQLIGVDELWYSAPKMHACSLPGTLSFFMTLLRCPLSWTTLSTLLGLLHTVPSPHPRALNCRTPSAAWGALLPLASDYPSPVFVLNILKKKKGTQEELHQHWFLVDSFLYYLLQRTLHIVFLLNPFINFCPSKHWYPLVYFLLKSC